MPGTGFEPAHPCERCDLNTVRLPISPPGRLKSEVIKSIKIRLQMETLKMEFKLFKSHKSLNPKNHGSDLWFRLLH